MPKRIAVTELCRFKLKIKNITIYLLIFLSKYPLYFFFPVIQSMTENVSEDCKQDNVYRNAESFLIFLTGNSLLRSESQLIVSKRSLSPNTFGIWMNTSGRHSITVVAKYHCSDFWLKMLLHQSKLPAFSHQSIAIFGPNFL